MWLIRLMHRGRQRFGKRPASGVWSWGSNRGEPVFEKVFHCLARGGTILTCGATAGWEVTMNLWPFFVKQQRLIGSYGRTRAYVEAILEWATIGKIKPLIHQTFPLERTRDGFCALRNRNVLGKIFVTV